MNNCNVAKCRECRYFISRHIEMLTINYYNICMTNTNLKQKHIKSDIIHSIQVFYNMYILYYIMTNSSKP